MSDTMAPKPRFPSPRKGWDRRVNRHPFGRRTFGGAKAGIALSPRFGGVDTVVPDLRRRIDETGMRTPRLPVAVGALVILVTSTVLWANIGALAAGVATHFAAMH